MKKSKIQFGTILLVLAALVNLARWTGLFTFSDHAPAWIMNVIPILDAISGLFTGLAVAGGLAFIAHRLGAMQPFTPKGRPIMRFWGAALSLLLILILSAFLLPPYIRMTTPQELRAEIGDLGTWSVMAVLVGDLIIVAVALADGKSAGFTRSSRTPAPKTRSAKPSRRSSGPAKSVAKISCKYQCGKSFASQNAANAHAAKCKFKPTTVLPEEAKKEPVKHS